MGDKTMSPIDPVSVLLVSKGSRGDKLLFRYPFDDDAQDSAGGGGNVGTGNASIRGVDADSTSQINAGVVSGATQASNHVTLTVKKNVGAGCVLPNQRHHNNAASSPSFNRNPYTLPAGEEHSAQPSACPRSATVPNTCLR